MCWGTWVAAMLDFAKLINAGVPISLVCILLGGLALLRTYGPEDSQWTPWIAAGMVSMWALTVLLVAAGSWVNRRFEKIQKDADECGKAYRDCIAARARFEERALNEERQRIRVEARLDKLEHQVNGGSA